MGRGTVDGDKSSRQPELPSKSWTTGKRDALLLLLFMFEGDLRLCGFRLDPAGHPAGHPCLDVLVKFEFAVCALKNGQKTIFEFLLALTKQTRSEGFATRRARAQRTQDTRKTSTDTKNLVGT